SVPAARPSGATTPAPAGGPWRSLPAAPPYGSRSSKPAIGPGAVSPSCFLKGSGQGRRLLIADPRPDVLQTPVSGRHTHYAFAVGDALSRLPREEWPDAGQALFCLLDMAVSVMMHAAPDGRIRHAEGPGERAR